MSERTTAEAKRPTFLKRHLSAIVGAVALSTGGVAACGALFNDGIPECGERISVDRQSHPNGKVRIDDEVYGVDVSSLAGEPLVVLTKGRLFADRASSTPVVMPIEARGTSYIGRVTLEGNVTFDALVSSDLDTVYTTCS